MLKISTVKIYTEYLYLRIGPCARHFSLREQNKEICQMKHPILSLVLFLANLLFLKLASDFNIRIAQMI